MTSMSGTWRSPRPRTWPTRRNSPQSRRSSPRRPRREDDLECGPFQGSKLKHNCSGKHAGMLALCHAQGWPYEGYTLAEHPCQQAMLAEVTQLAGTSEIPTAVDGCGVVTFALSLERMATAFTHIDERIAAAMRANPELIRGQGALDTKLMRALPGWTAKGGAEALLCAAGSGRPRDRAQGRRRTAACAAARAGVVPRPARRGRVRVRPVPVRTAGRGCRSGN